METLGEDLILLAVRPNGTLAAAHELRFGLAGSELVRLAAARRVDVVRGRIAVLDPAPTGDRLLDAALQTMEGSGSRQPTAKAWVQRTRRGLVEGYLDRTAAAGLIRAERGMVLGLIPRTRWKVMDTGRLALARAKLDAVASGPGAADAEQAALAGLAYAIGLIPVIYPGGAGATARKNIKRAATDSRRPTIAATSDAANASAASATDAATRAAVSAATDAAIRAATDAAIAASINAATQAATDAASHAAAHHGGGAVGGHH
jgi:hypothetical protein